MMSAQFRTFTVAIGSEYIGQVCPITRCPFQPGDNIVICTNCNTAYNAEGWAYVGEVCQICGFQVSESAEPTQYSKPPLPSGAWLYMLESLGGSRRFSLRDNGDTRIGRGPENDIVLDSNFVSWDHALVRGDQGHFILYDRASRNGTWLNGHHIQRSILYDGDVLTFGDNITLVFKQVRD